MILSGNSFNKELKYSNYEGLEVGAFVKFLLVSVTTLVTINY